MLVTPCTLRLSGSLYASGDTNHRLLLSPHYAERFPLMRLRQLSTQKLPAFDQLFAQYLLNLPMPPSQFAPQLLQMWNWKCALLSSVMRSAVYLAALARNPHAGAQAIVLVEIAYVTLTAGLWAGLQQRALHLRQRALGNLIVVVAIPLTAQGCDALAHRLAGPAVPAPATAAISLFALVSALFHLYVMRRGAFLTGTARPSLLDDLRRMPRLIADLALLTARA